MSRKASIVWGVVPLSEAQASFDLKLEEKAHKTNIETKVMGKWKKDWDVLRRTQFFANTGCQQIR